MLIDQESAKKNAPCYWVIKDDGAPLRCHECNQSFRAQKEKTMLYCFVPSGKVNVLCWDCCDEDWRINAKNMGEF